VLAIGEMKRNLVDVRLWQRGIISPNAGQKKLSQELCGLVTPEPPDHIARPASSCACKVKCFPHVRYPTIDEPVMPTNINAHRFSVLMARRS
jgi:hypothetical protein